MNPTIDISIAHSPDSDDAFMFYGRPQTRSGCRIQVHPHPHRHPNPQPPRQKEAFYDVTAISFHAYPYVQENYTLMGCGGTVGEG